MSASGSPPVVAIVGAGFSGSMLTCQLLHQSKQSLRVLLIDRTGRFGPGVAYGTHDPGHLLNVSAGAMSVWPDDPSHLLRWLDLNRTELSDVLPRHVDASTFIPRLVYGLYLRSTLDESASLVAESTSLDCIDAELIDLQPLDDKQKSFRLHLTGHAPIDADQVVLAWGNSALPTSRGASRYVRHAWDHDALHDLDPDATVVLLGTGLTMVDMLVSLSGRGHRGLIYAFSRHGYRPTVHRPCIPLGDWLDPDTAPVTVRGLLRLIRDQVRKSSAQGLDWRSVIDGLRPRTQQLWARMPHVEKRRFQRHVSSVWDVHRHRIAPDLEHLLGSLQATGQLQIEAARLLTHEADDAGVRLRIRRRGQAHATQELRADRMIFCTGIPLDYSRGLHPLMSKLLQRGLLQPDPLGLGALCDSDGGLIRRDGHGQAGLYTIGSPRRGQLWETTAVAEIRQQARDLAHKLLRNLPRSLQGLPPIVGPRAHDDSSGSLLVRQLFDPGSSTFTYLIADPTSGDAVLIDPVLEHVERDLSLLYDLGFRLSSCLETHLHADHITSADQLRRRTGCRLVVPAVDGIRGADQLLRGGERLSVGGLSIEAISTPGHTAQHMAYRIGNTHLFSGDALLIRGCGRTDFQGGDPGLLYDSLQTLLALPDAMLVYPCHDYNGFTHSSIGEERRLNPKLNGRSRDAFIQLMQAQRLAPPTRIDEALPANLHLGDLSPPDHHRDDRLRRQLEGDQARAMEEANREIYNSFMGMFI